ncbi:Gfo/Idh/MocA family protein [Arsukibacterium sp.]|uniref:Gfo/Idh/MocA family protein n=1 Tax=Arsukibacterium sp. TaxID=1977258 RepID=UPI0035678ED2
MPQFGVIGLGSIGKRHLTNLRTLFPDAQLLAVSASSRAKHNVPANATMVSLAELLAIQPDFVVVASPASLHLQHTEALLAQGIPALVEKPLCASSLQAEQFMQLVERYPASIIDIGYCLRYLPAAQMVKTLISSQRLGRIYSVIAQVGQYLPYWRPDSDYRVSVSAQAALGGGALLELSHELDYLQWLLGPLQLRYARNRHSGLLTLDVEDISELVLENENHTSCFVHLDFIQQTPLRQCSFIAGNARLDWDLIANTITLQEHNQRHLLYDDAGYDKNNMYLAMLNAFWQKVQQRDSDTTNFTAAAATVKLIAQAKQQGALENL